MPLFQSCETELKPHINSLLCDRMKMTSRQALRLKFMNAVIGRSRKHQVLGRRLAPVSVLLTEITSKRSEGDRDGDSKCCGA